MRREAEPARGPRREPHLLRRPCLPRRRIAPDLRRGEAVEGPPGMTARVPFDLAAALRLQARANRLANLRLQDAMAPLSRDELHAPRISFFPSLMKTLNQLPKPREGEVL